MTSYKYFYELMPRVRFDWILGSQYEIVPTHHYLICHCFNQPFKNPL
jgi:hypothetical protein